MERCINGTCCRSSDDCTHTTSQPGCGFWVTILYPLERQLSKYSTDESSRPSCLFFSFDLTKDETFHHP